jgi:hypothetical protein
MFGLFLVLTIVSGAVLIVGFAWWLAASGKTTRRSGPDVGAEIMGGQASDDQEVGLTLLEKSVFAGKGAAVEREADVSVADLKGMLRQRQWRGALPPLLVIGGLCGLVLFGALALWARLDDKLIGTLILAVALFAVVRVARDFVRR